MSEAFSIQSLRTTWPLMSMPEDRLRVLRGLVGRVGELDPAGLPAAPGQHLGLDDDLAADLLGRRAGLVRGRREPPLGDRESRTA